MNNSSFIVTVLGIITAVGGPICMLDIILRQETKDRFWRVIVEIAKIGERPFSFAFYGLCTVTSVAFTVVIFVLCGFIHWSAGGSRWSALTSSAPLMLGIVLKILFLDYLLAIKTWGVIDSMRREAARSVTLRPAQRWRRRCRNTIVVFMDLWLSFFATALFFVWAQTVQDSLLVGLDDRTKTALAPALGFFDEINLMVKLTVEQSFFLLNGALLMCAALFVSHLTTRAVGFLNVDGIRRSIFTLTACFIGAIVLAVAKTYAPLLQE